MWQRITPRSEGVTLWLKELNFLLKRKFERIPVNLGCEKIAPLRKVG